MSLGDLISGSGNTLNQIAQAMKPPSPAPNPNPGAPGPAPGGGNQMAPPPAGQQQQQPSTAPASPPDLTAAYIKLMQQDRAANMFDRGLAGLQASFAPPGQQAAWLGSAPPEQDAGAQIGNLMKIQQAQVAAQEHAQAAAGAESAYQALFPGAKPGLGTELFNMGKLGDVMQSHIASMNPTEAQKNADAATSAYAQANPKATPQDLASFKSNLLAGAMGGSDLDQRQYLSATQAGLFHGTYEDWKNQNVAQGKQMADFATQRADAATSFVPVDASWKAVQDNLEYLNKNKDAAIIAIQHPDWETTGQIGRNLPSWFGGQPQNVLDAKNALTQLQAQLKTEAFRNTKNVRSNKEAQFLGDAATPIFSPTNSDAAITTGLQTLLTQATTGRANATAAAGRPIPHEWASNVDPQLLDPKNPLYNGSQVQPAPDEAAPTQTGGAGLKPLPDETVQWIQQKLKTSPGERDAVLKHFQGLGFDVSKL